MLEKKFGTLHKKLHSNPAIVNTVYNEPPPPDIINEMIGPVPCHTRIMLFFVALIIPKNVEVNYNKYSSVFD